MKNVITDQTRFTVTQTNYEETAGMVKGFSRTRNLIKLYDNGVFVKEFTNAKFDVMVAVLISEDNSFTEAKVCINENAVKRTYFWSYRKQNRFILIK
tara:strand:- start:287 stop:577 length:291 start_codon:yes stop_codon:yes gene_type:complete